MEKSKLVEAVQSSSSISEASRKLNISRYQLWKIATDLKINLISNQSGFGISKKKQEGSGKVSLFEILRGDHPSYQTGHLKERLIKEGIKKNCCEECGIDQWNGKSIVCHLDHVNGISSDHRLENLRMLCPNCHSQTETYCGKNRSRSSTG